MVTFIFLKRCILVLLLTPLIRPSSSFVCSYICCDCDALENLTKTTCTNTTKVVPVANPVTNIGVIIGAAGGGIVFGSVVTVLVFVCIWRALCKETNRMITNPVYDPGDGTVEENTKEQNGENTTYNEIKDITISKVGEPAKQREQSSSRKDMDNQFIGLDKENKSGKYDRLVLVVSNKMDGYEPMNAHSDNTDDQKGQSAGECENQTVDENEKSDDYFVVEKIAINE